MNEAFFTIYFLALLIQALIGRELRQTMQRERLKALPLYPEGRRCVPLRLSGQRKFTEITPAMCGK